MLKQVKRIFKRACWRGEGGVVTAESVAVTAAFVLVAITVAWIALSAALTDAIGVVGEGLLEFIETAFS